MPVFSISKKWEAVTTFRALSLSRGDSSSEIKAPMIIFSPMISSDKSMRKCRTQFSSVLGGRRGLWRSSEILDVSNTLCELSTNVKRNLIIDEKANQNESHQSL